MESKSVIISNEFTKFFSFESYDKLFLVADKKVSELWIEKFMEFSNLKKYKVEIFLIEATESNKTLETYEKLVKVAIDKSINRNCAVIGLGGGIIGDLVGFFAGSYYRGIDLYHVPTTLLSQIDSSIGGKTGVNFKNIKNVMGLFYEAKGTFISSEFLTTLDEEEYISGLGEVLKYYFLGSDKLGQYLKSNTYEILNRNQSVLNEVIKLCVEKKLEIVAKDPKEMGLRKILNLGHTFGHGIELEYHISHGKSVAWGMEMAFKYSNKKGYISDELLKLALELIKQYNLHIELEFSVERVIENMKKDKKNSGDEITLILPVDICEVGIFKESESDISDFLRSEFNASKA